MSSILTPAARSRLAAVCLRSCQQKSSILAVARQFSNHLRDDCNSIPEGLRTTVPAGDFTIFFVGFCGPAGGTAEVFRYAVEFDSIFSQTGQLSWNCSTVKVSFGLTRSDAAFRALSWDLNASQSKPTLNQLMW